MIDNVINYIMKYINLIYFLLFFINDTSAQKQDYVWMLGGVGTAENTIEGMIWSWSNDESEPMIIDLPYRIGSVNASISDENGNLLFWSNGCSVVNRNHKVMPNGDTLNWDPIREIVSGWDTCEYGYVGRGNIKIVPDPRDFGEEQKGFYIIHKARRYNSQNGIITTDLRYSYVDMTLDSGLGDVVYYDSILYDGAVTNSNLEVILKENGKDWWIIQPVEDDSIMITYSIDQDGITRMPDQSSNILFSDKRAGAGTMRISPDGSKLAYYDYFLNLHVYDFNQKIGEISNHQKVTIFEDAEDMPIDKFRFGSVEWSPNSRFMYVAVRDSLFQVDSWEANMNEGIRLIDVYDGAVNPFATTFYVASLAPDCKIYIGSTSGNRSCHIIHEPNELGTACNFVQNGLQIPGPNGTNIPIHPRFRINEEEKCNPLITSVFDDLVYYRRDLAVYPNPASDIITIELPENIDDSQLIIYDIQGQVMLTREINHSGYKIVEDISQLISGIYHVELYPKNNPDRILYGKQIVKIE